VFQDYIIDQSFKNPAIKLIKEGIEYNKYLHDDG